MIKVIHGKPQGKERKGKNMTVLKVLKMQIEWAEKQMTEYKQKMDKYNIENNDYTYAQFKDDMNMYYWYQNRHNALKEVIDLYYILK